MRTMPRLPCLLPLVLVAACGSSGPTTLVVTGASFTAVEGKTLKLALVDVSAKKIDQTATATVTGGKFTFTLNVAAGTSYRADLFADDDKDGKCQWGVDHVYAVDVADIAEGKSVTKTVIADGIDSRGCLSFGASSLHVTVKNFQATGTVFEAALFRCSDPGCTSVDDKSLRGAQTGSVANNTVDFTFAGGMIPGFYQVSVFINNGTGSIKCDAADTIVSKGGAALGGTQTDGLTGQTVEWALDGTTDKATAAICGLFP